MKYVLGNADCRGNMNHSKGKYNRTCFNAGRAFRVFVYKKHPNDEASYGPCHYVGKNGKLPPPKKHGIAAYTIRVYPKKVKEPWPLDRTPISCTSLSLLKSTETSGPSKKSAKPWNSMW